MYDEMGVGHDGDGLDAAALLTNNSGRPLLVSGKGAANSAAGHVLVPLEVHSRTSANATVEETLWST